MSHTPGPWRIEEEFTYGPTSIVAADGSTLMCSESYYPSVPGNDDDWKLIAAAPELLEALKKIEELTYLEIKLTAEQILDIWKLSQAAIAKATGGAQ